MWQYSFVILLLCIGLGNSLPTPVALVKDGEQPVSDSASGNALATTEAPSDPSQSPNRRVITFDQRQEGKYNIRADLENFVIMVIPSSPSSASALLNLLGRSKFKKTHGKNGLRRKFSHKVQGDPKEGVKKLDYLPARADHSERSNTRIIEHFIEGRTPYKVDISSNGEYLHPQVQVVQPNYARSLRSPVVVRLEPEEPVASVVAVKGNSNPIQNTVTDRQSKTLFEANQNDDSSNTNSLVILTPNHNDYNSESNSGFVDLTDPSNSFDSLNVGNIDQFAVTAVNKEANREDVFDSGSDEDRGWELTLLGAQEQCGPDRRRDSYGICQFVPDY